MYFPISNWMEAASPPVRRPVRWKYDDMAPPRGRGGRGRTKGGRGRGGGGGLRGSAGIGGRGKGRGSRRPESELTDSGVTALFTGAELWVLDCVCSVELATSVVIDMVVSRAVSDAICLCELIVYGLPRVPFACY